MPCKPGSRRRWAASGSRSRDQLGGAFEVGKQHGHLLAFTFQGASGGEDFLREIGWGVGERGLGRGFRWNRVARSGARASVQTKSRAPRRRRDLGMGIEEFFGEIMQGVII